MLGLFSIGRITLNIWDKIFYNGGQNFVESNANLRISKFLDS